MFRSSATRLAAIVLTMAVGASPGAAAEPHPSTTEPPPPAPPSVEYRDGRLSVDATNVPPMEIFARIREVTGADVQGSITDPPTVSVSFRDAPVREAINRILPNASFTLRYGADGSLHRITLRAPAAPPDAAPPTHGPGARRDFQTAWLKAPPLPLQGDLATAFGRQRVVLPHLLRSVRTLQDRRLRREAVTTFVRTVEASRDLRGPWESMRASDLASFARHQAGGNAAEMLADLAGATRSPRTRVEAQQALRLVLSARSQAR
jgi:hypothetical protein